MKPCKDCGQKMGSIGNSGKQGLGMGKPTTSAAPKQKSVPAFNPPAPLGLPKRFYK